MILYGETKSHEINNDMNQRVVGYIRVSTEEQAQDGASLKMQADSIRAFAKSQGWELCKIYEDRGYSATNIQRPALQEFFEDIKESDYTSLLVYKIDRLTRRLKHLIDFVELLEKQGLAFTSVTESFNTHTANGRLVLNLLGTVAQWERDTIAERTRDTLKNIAQGGKHIGRPPVGFKAGKNGLTVDDEGLKTYKLIRELRGRGRNTKSYRSIAELLNEMHKPTVGASPKWNASTVHYILHNQTLKGVVKFKDDQFIASHRSILNVDVQEVNPFWTKQEVKYA